MTRMFTPGRLCAVVVAGVMFVGLSLPASAAPVFTSLGAGSLITGNPCDPTGGADPICELFEVSNLQAGDFFDVFWNFTSGADTIDADARFTMTSVVGDTLTLTVDMTNNSTSVGTNSITLLTITTGDETLGSAATDGTVFDVTDIDGTFINLAYDVCVFANDPPTCTGGAVGGGLLGGGGNEVFNLTLTSLTNWDEPFTLDHFIIKYQGDDSFEKPGTPGEVPEPSTLLLFATGLLGLGVLARRRRTA